MIYVSLKNLLEEIKKRQISTDPSDGPQFYMFAQMKKLVDKDVKGKVNKEQFENEQISHQHVQQLKMFDKYLSYTKIQQSTNIEQTKKLKTQSDTISLSFIVDQKSDIRFMESLQWFQLLGANEKIFKHYMFNSKYAKIQKLDENNYFDQFSNLIIGKGNNTYIFSGLNLKDYSQIAIKETTANRVYLEQAQHYILHAEIYELYPNIFLQIILPVYIYTLSQEKVRFVSQMELGEINLFLYSQQNKISDNEYQLIYQQLFNQIMLLHKHQIAHRDIKPQNIIFVKNKGWLLCDFGEAIKYSQQISVYNIRGTFGFIPPKIYQASKIGDVLVKQDLLYNDLYAFGITLLIIKHQISKQIEIQQFMDKQDNIIKLLLNNTTPTVDKLEIPRDIQYIEPIIEKQRKFDPQYFSNKEISEYLKILNQANGNVSPPFLKQVIKTLDEFLKKQQQNELVYLNACQHIYYCSRYIKQFTNLLAFKKLRSLKFWRQKIQNEDLNIQELAISFMSQLGFVDLVLKYGSTYINKSYSFTIHLIIIELLILLKEKERALNEYELLLKFRDQYYMNDIDLRQLIQISIIMMDYRFIDESELNYFADRQFKALRIDVSKMNLNLNDTDESICQQFIHECTSYQMNTYDYWVDQSMTEMVKQQINELFRLSLQDMLNDHINKTYKYSCTAFHQQNDLKISIINKMFLCNNQQYRKIKKQMNYLLIHHSESKHQYQINNLIKQNVILFTRQNDQKLRKKSFIRIQTIIRAFKNIPYIFYQYTIVDELSQIFFQQVYFYEKRFVKIAILSLTLMVEQVIKICDQITIKQFMFDLLVLFRISRNFKRVKQLDTYQAIALNSEQYKFQKLLLQGKIKQIRLLRRQNKILQKEFLFDQYLSRKQ